MAKIRETEKFSIECQINFWHQILSTDIHFRAESITVITRKKNKTIVGCKMNEFTKKTINHQS